MNTYTGTVKKAEIKILPPFNPYKYWGGGTMEIFVEVAVDLEGGLTAYFKKMVGTHHVATGGPFAISVYMIDSDCPWVTELNKDKSVASPGIPAQNTLQLNLHEGDTITITARQKGEERISRKGNRYVSLTHVKYVHAEHQVAA